MKDFVSFLTEDGVVAGGANVAAGAQNYESPMGSSQPTAGTDHTAGNIGTAKRKKNGTVVPLPPAPNPPKIQEDYELATRDFLRELGRSKIPNYAESFRMNRATHLDLGDYAGLATDLGKNGITIHAVDRNPKDLKPTQRNFEWEKVQNMATSGRYLDPVVISQDDYVIDGHHRWLAACMNEDPVIAARMIKMGAEDAIEWLKDKNYPRNRDKMQEGARYVPGAGMVGGASDEYPEDYEVNSAGEYMPKASKAEPVKHLHQVKYNDRDAAKAEGLRWDPQEKSWYHTDHQRSVDSKFPYKSSFYNERKDDGTLQRHEWTRPGSVQASPAPVKRIYPFKYVHNVNFKDKEDAKAEGMMWDPEEKHWYHSDPDKSMASKFPFKKTIPG